MRLAAQNKSTSSVHVASGMPPLDMQGRQTSFFEFWPTWLIYLPVVLQSLFFALRHRSLTLPLIANPRLPLSGMVGVGKSELLAQATGLCAETVLDWFVFQRETDDIEGELVRLQHALSSHNFSYPFVCKPDIGCRGVGVKLVHDADQLERVLKHYPLGAGMFVQKLSSWEPEAGVFYVREPDQDRGKIISMALKYSPYVVGDGKRTLKALIEDDVRAGALSHLYLERHKANLDSVIEQGKAYRLVFSASHCRGAIFRDGNVYISGELEQRIDEIMKGLPDFHYGRLDLKFRDVESLMKGEYLEIVEINSASSEPLHIWDRKTTFWQAISALLFQYRILFRLGAKNRRKGFKPPSFGALIKAWKKETSLTQVYPETD